MDIFQARKLLGEYGENLSDEEIDKIISFLSSIAHVVINDFMQKRED